MLKCTLKSPKTINGDIGEKTNFLKKNCFFEEKNFFLFRNFFSPNIISFATQVKREGNKCHGCIRNEFSKWVGTHEILQLNDMSKIWQKHGF